MHDKTETYPKSEVPIPIVPEDISKRFHVSGIVDTRFAGCARLLQSVWRERHGFEMGRHKPKGGKPRKLGSLLDPALARTGVNFLAPDIAKLVRREVAYREIGALIDERRLWTNLLSSQTLTFNLLARAKLDLGLASRLFRQLLPDLMETVDEITFEHSPGRGDPNYLGDYTAFDAFVTGWGPNGEPTFVAIEVKYSESMRQPGRSEKERYRELTRAFALHIDPEAPSLLAEPLAQLTAEHVLAAVIRHRMGPEARGAFLTIAPALNRDAWNALDLYRTTLTYEPKGVAFVPATLEAVIAAIRAAGDEVSATRLTERYTDFGPVHALIEEWEPFAE